MQAISVTKVTSILSKWIPIIDELGESPEIIWGNLAYMFNSNGYNPYSGATLIHEYAGELGEHGKIADEWLVTHGYVPAGKIRRTDGKINCRLANLKELPLSMEMKEYLSDLQIKGLSLSEIRSCFYTRFGFEADEQKMIDCLYRNSDRNRMHYNN